MDGERSALDEHMLQLARARRGADRPRISFVPTASGDNPDYVARFHVAFDAVAETSHIGLFDRTIADLAAHVAGQDALYVGGGNTASLLAVWQAHGLDEVIRSAHAAGIVLAGLSAGSICWFESGTTDSYGPPLQAVTGGLGLIAGSHSPHYDGEPERRPTYHALVGAGRLSPGLAIDDHAAAVFDGPDLVEVVAAHAGPTAYRVEPDAHGGVHETPLVARVLP